MKQVLLLFFLLSVSSYAQQATVIKPIVAFELTGQNTINVLKDEALTINCNPPGTVVSVSDRANAVEFEMNKMYHIVVSYPGYEDQFYDFSTSQVPELDTLFFMMIPKGQPYYYTRYNKRVYEADSAEIIIVPDRYANTEKFRQLVSSLDLVQSELNSGLYRKRSGENFGLANDTVLTYLRKSDLVVAAGPNLGTGKNWNVMTNRIHIVWADLPEKRIDASSKVFEAFVQQYHLKKEQEGNYSASPEIGLELNALIEKLNLLEGVHVAYPELYTPLYVK